MKSTTEPKELRDPTREYIVIRAGSVFEADSLQAAITRQLEHGGTIYTRLRTGHESIIEIDETA